MALGVVSLGACGSDARASVEYESSGGAPTGDAIASIPDATLAYFDAIVSRYSDAKAPDTADYVVGQRAALLEELGVQGTAEVATAQDLESVFLIQAQGSFTYDSARVPPGEAPPTGRVLYIVVPTRVAEGAEPMAYDLGVANVPLDLEKAGTVGQVLLGGDERN